MSAIENFRKVLNDLREKDESALPKLIKATGMSPDSIYGYLKGSEPRLSQAERIAHALGIPLAAMIGDNPPQLPPPPKPREPSPLDIAIYLFDHGAQDVPQDRIDVIKRALEADDAQLAVMRKQIENLFPKPSIDGADTGSSG